MPEMRTVRFEVPKGITHDDLDDLDANLMKLMEPHPGNAAGLIRDKKGRPLVFEGSVSEVWTRLQEDRVHLLLPAVKRVIVQAGKKGAGTSQYRIVSDGVCHDVAAVNGARLHAG